MVPDSKLYSESLLSLLTLWDGRIKDCVCVCFRNVCWCYIMTTTTQTSRGLPSGAWTSAACRLCAGTARCVCASCVWKVGTLSVPSAAFLTLSLLPPASGWRSPEATASTSSEETSLWRKVGISLCHLSVCLSLSTCLPLVGVHVCLSLSLSTYASIYIFGVSLLPLSSYLSLCLFQCVSLPPLSPSRSSLLSLWCCVVHEGGRSHNYTGSYILIQWR